MKRLLSVTLLLVFCIGLFGGCAEDGQTILVDDFQMEIPAYFENKSNESYAKDYNFLYTYGGIGFLGIQEKRSDFPAGYENMDLEAYGKFVIFGNNLSCELQKKDGFYTFSYEKDAPEGKLRYVAIVLESDDAFWTVQAYCISNFYEENASFMWDCLTSAKLH
jgi:hypothetical protein